MLSVEVEEIDGPRESCRWRGEDMVKVSMERRGQGDDEREQEH